MEKGRHLTGARARFSIDGVRIGYATNVTLGEAITYEPIKVLGNIRKIEDVAVDYDVQFSARFFRIVGETVKSMGLFPKAGANSEEHLLNILTSGVMTATLEDVKTKQAVAVVREVKIASHNYSVDARGVVGEDVTFTAVLITDESEN